MSFFAADSGVCVTLSACDPASNCASCMSYDSYEYNEFDANANVPRCEKCMQGYYLVMG